MTNHPKRSRKFTVTTLTGEPMVSAVLGREFTNAEAFAAAKRAAGKGARFNAHYGPDACAYVGINAVAVIAR